MSKKVIKKPISIAIDNKSGLKLQLGMILGAIEAKDNELFDKAEKSWIDNITPEHKKEIELFLRLLNVVDSIEFFPISTGFEAKYSISLKSQEAREEASKALNQLLGNPYILSLVDAFYLRKPTKKPKKEKIRQSAHLTENLLKYDNPKDRKNKQLELFLDMDLVLKERFNKLGIDKEEAVTRIAEGIRLTAQEEKLVDALICLLHNKSQTKKPKDKNYYTGNRQPEVVQYGGTEATSPKLFFTLYELTKAYKGGEEEIGGKDTKNVRDILVGFSNRDFVISYSRRIAQENGKSKVQKIRGIEKLIKILELSETEYSADQTELSKKTEILVALSPIFIDQIDSKFILVPSDINKRLEIVYGNAKISEEALRLKRYLLELQSNKKGWSKTHKIDLETLYYKLADRKMKSYRRSRVAKETDKALEAMKTLGLLLDYRLETGKKGQPQVILEVNKAFE